MRHHEAVDVGLPALCPLPVVPPNDLRAVPQNVRNLLERCAVLQQPRGKGVPIPMGVGIFDPRFREDSG